MSDLSDASFPILGRIKNPQAADYRQEARLLEALGRPNTAAHFWRVSRKLGWTPEALRQMAEADRPTQAQAQ